MNGGIFIIGKEKECVGIYFNFKMIVQEWVLFGEWGIVVFLVVLSWGEVKMFVFIFSVEDFNKKVGFSIDDLFLLFLCEVKKNVKMVLMYCLIEGV